MANIINNGKIILIILGILIDETLILTGFVFYGLGIHIINLFLILILIFSSEPKMVGVLHSLVLLVLIRMIYLSMPPFFSEYLQYLLILGVMVVPIYLTIKCQQCQKRTNDLGIFDKRYVHMSLSIAAGFLLDVAYNGIIGPDPSTIYLGGVMMTIFLIICLSISLLLPDKYLDQKHISYSLDICSIPAILTFLSILIFRIISI